MKKFVKIILMCLLACSLAFLAVSCSKSSSSSTDKTPGLQYKTVDGEKYVVAYVAEKDEKDVTVTIPADVDKIKAGAFENNATIIKIIVPSTVKEIGAGAFKKMKALKELNLPYVGATIDAVNAKKTLGYLFGTEEYDEGTATVQSYNASSNATYYLPTTLTSITVNAVNEYALSAYAFYGCKYISSFTLTGNITAIGDYAFYGCYMLQSLTIPDSVKSIGSYAFVECTRLKGEASNLSSASLKFSTSTNLEEIGASAFLGTKLTKFIIPEGVKKIGNYAFASKTSSLAVTDQSEIKTIVLPNTLTEINQYTFYFATKLTTVKYGTGLTRIWPNAFNYCSKLQSFSDNNSTSLHDDEGEITLVDEITTVGANAFSNCGNNNIRYTLTYNTSGNIFEEGRDSAFVNTICLK